MKTVENCFELDEDGRRRRGTRKVLAEPKQEGGGAFDKYHVPYFYLHYVLSEKCPSLYS